MVDGRPLVMMVDEDLKRVMHLECAAAAGLVYYGPG